MSSVPFDMNQQQEDQFSTARLERILSNFVGCTLAAIAAYMFVSLLIELVEVMAGH